MVGPFKVQSLANGNLTITPGWRDFGTTDCGAITERDADGQCVKCHMPHIGSVFDRMATARIIEQLLNRTAKPPQRKA